MKLKVRLTLWFLAISLSPMLLVMYFSYSMTRSALLVQIFNQLESIANVQQDRIETLIADRRREVSQFAERPQLRAMLRTHGHRFDASSRGEFDTLLTSIKSDMPHLKEITLLDLEGNVIGSTARRPLGANVASAPWFQVGRTQSNVTLEFDPQRKSLRLRVVGPLIHDESDLAPDDRRQVKGMHLIGVCELILDAYSLANLVADRTGLGDSGEFLVVHREPGGDAYAITPMRTRPDAPLRMYATHLERGTPTTHDVTTLDKEVHEGIDPHGALVYVTTRHIELADWSLVVKVDKEDALKPIHAFRDLVMWAMVALTLLTVLASFSLARSITEPLEAFTQAAQRASSGDLSTRVPVTSGDELGILGKAFNHMSEQLAAMQVGLETKVTARTAELESANARLKELDQLKSEFLATMSHELRTPLNSILGFSDILMGEETNLVAESREQLQCIYTSARHLLKIIEEILEVSKIEAGHMNLEREWVSVGDLVRQAADFLRPQAARNQLALNVTMASPEPILAYTDPHKLLRVLVNLIGNAVKFTHQGGVFITARLVPGTLDGLVVMEIRDTGIGIRPGDLSKLFQPFSQLDSSTRRQYEGTGLGLYYSKKVVELLGGTLSVESRWQEGSTFTVRLQSRSAEAPARPSETELSASSAASQKMAQG